MRILILALLGVFASAASAADERSAEIEKLIAEAKASIEPRVIPGGKSLQDIFGMWFAKVDRTDENGLSVRLMRGGTDKVSIYTDEHSSWKYIGAGNTVNISPGNKKIIWIDLCSIEISLDRKSFPASDCLWLTNSAHTVYVKLQRCNEFNATDIIDEYFVSLDLKKAYYLQGKREVDYPFPFVNPRPDISQEEWELQMALPGFMSFVDEWAEIYKTRCLPVRPGEVRNLKTKDEDGRSEVWYVVFGADCRSLTCVDYFPADKGKVAEAVLLSLDYSNNRFRVGGMSCDGGIDFVRVVESGVLKRRRDEAFKRAFAREVLTRLKLTVQDLPGINLDATLGAE